MDILKSHLCFKDMNGQLLLKTRLTQLKLQEKSIIHWSTIWFNDPEPCMIHRSAVMKRLFLEFAECIEKHTINGNKEMDWIEVPNHLKQILQITEDVHTVSFSHFD